MEKGKWLSKGTAAPHSELRTTRAGRHGVGAPLSQPGHQLTVRGPFSGRYSKRQTHRETCPAVRQGMKQKQHPIYSNLFCSGSVKTTAVCRYYMKHSSSWQGALRCKMTRLNCVLTTWSWERKPSSSSLSFHLCLFD